MRVNNDLVVKQGLLYKRGNLLKMYNNQYNFYLEKKDPLTGAGPFLKFGRRGKTISTIIDLSMRLVDGLASVKNGIMALKEPDSNTRFKIITSEETLHLKAENKSERDNWI